ncbi:PAS domain-containing sensor histidine kinase [Bordetella trematum]|uniref:PAS domain-containing sensor histidine kinase n=1 Tax=Bordetella trematum TaxID=123899 RepID=UPI00052F346E|nr:PAS domain-containing sensor histidine kinase [Bordetella trematum]
MQDLRWPLSQDATNYRLLFEGLIEQSVAGIYLLQNAHLVYVNDAFARLCGVPREKLVGRPLAKVAPPQQRDSLLKQYERRLTGDKDSTFTVRLQLPGGGERALEIHGRRIDFNGEPAVIGVGIDATERLQRQAELQQSRAALAELVNHIETLREAERQRFAMELHDAVGGMLSALKFDLSRLSRQLHKTPDEPAQAQRLTQMMGQCLSLLQDTITTVRQISEDLHPSALPHLGLPVAIENHLRQFETRYGLICHYRKQPAPLALDADAMAHLYRIFQESLTNVAKHAQARHVWVTLEHDGGALELTVRDDGVGLPQAQPRPGSYGLMGMRERARLLGGTLALEPAPDGGTCLRLRLPDRPAPSRASA